MDTFSHFIDLKNVKITDNFWNKNIEKIRTKMIPYQWKALNDEIPNASKSHAIDNFKLCIKLKQLGKSSLSPNEKHYGAVFQDSDLYKWIEAASYSLINHPDPELKILLNNVVTIIGEAQMEDGYLDTYYILTDISKRFTNLKENHELYCLGHLIEASIAYYMATNSQELLEIAKAYTNCVDIHIGKSQNKIHGYPGHPLLEMALIRLYEITMDIKYLDLATYFINERGTQPNFFDIETKKYNNKQQETSFDLKYFQADKPIKEITVAEGHAVRDLYLYSGVADVARLTNDNELYKSCLKIWEDLTQKQMYITGAFGQSAYGESFTSDYDLPNDLIYGETCASIAFIFFGQRLLRIHQNGLIAFKMEQALYNTVLSGSSLKGDAFFYVNPLEVIPKLNTEVYSYKHVKITRQKWFPCACCPPNLARLISSLSSYIYSVKDNNLYINLYIGNSANIKLKENIIKMNIETEYPNKGNIKIFLSEIIDSDFNLYIRKPIFTNNFSIQCNNSPINYSEENEYIKLSKDWQNNDMINLSIDMTPHFVKANVKVKEDLGKVAIMKGPLVFCIEEEDNGKYLYRLKIDTSKKIKQTFDEKLLGGITKLSVEGKRILENPNNNELYLIKEKSKNIEEDVDIIFIPYYAWNNRSIGEMSVWISE